ncbi:hypothetical protein D9M72_365130 [compost metagenome]
MTGVSVTDIDGDDMTASLHLLDRSAEDSEPPLLQPMQDRSIDLRRHAKTVNVPEGTQMAHEAAALRHRQRPPDLATLAAKRVENPMPARADIGRVLHGTSDALQQFERGSHRVAGEIAERLLGHSGMAA